MLDVLVGVWIESLPVALGVFLGLLGAYVVVAASWRRVIGTELGAAVAGSALFLGLLAACAIALAVAP